MRQRVERRSIEARGGLGPRDGAQRRFIEIGAVPHEQQAGQRAGRGDGWSGQCVGRHVQRRAEVERVGLRPRVGPRRAPLQAQGVGIGQHLQPRQVDRGQLVAQVAKAVVQQPPGGGGLAPTGVAHQQPNLAAALERRGMQEQQIAPLPLQRHRDSLLEAKQCVARPHAGLARRTGAAQQVPVGPTVLRERVTQMARACRGRCAQRSEVREKDLAHRHVGTVDVHRHAQHLQRQHPLAGSRPGTRPDSRRGRQQAPPQRRCLEYMLFFSSPLPRPFPG